MGRQLQLGFAMDLLTSGGVLGGLPVTVRASFIGLHGTFLTFRIWHDSITLSTWEIKPPRTIGYRDKFSTGLVRLRPIESIAIMLDR